MFLYNNNRLIAIVKFYLVWGIMKYKFIVVSLIVLFLSFSKSYLMMDALKSKGIWVNPLAKDEFARMLEVCRSSGLSIEKELKRLSALCELEKNGFWINPKFHFSSLIGECVDTVRRRRVVGASEEFVTFELIQQYGDLFSSSEHVFSYEQAIPTMSIAQSGLHQAVLWGKFDKIANFLSVKKIDVNSRNWLGQTLLHIAVIAGSVEVFTLILSFEPELNLIDIFGMTPYDYAISSNNLDFAFLLNVLGAEKLACLSEDL